MRHWAAVSFSIWSAMTCHRLGSAIRLPGENRRLASQMAKESGD
jgi:hypothetical protein